MAGDTARYAFGCQGVRGATIPPPGFYYNGDMIWYHADKTVDDEGDAIDLDFQMDLVCAAHRFICVSDFPAKAIGARYGAIRSSGRGITRRVTSRHSP